MSLDDHRFLKGFRSQIAGKNLLQDEDKKLKTTPGYDFFTGIVKDVISNPYEYLRQTFDNTEHSMKDVLSGKIKPEIIVGDTKKEVDISADIENSDLIETMPMNSIFSYIVDNNRSQDSGKYVVCYPFFPPHLSLPLKAGEYVWIIREKIGNLNYYYWLCRKVAPLQIDDLNFTNFERIPAVSNILTAKSNLSEREIDINGAYSLDEASTANYDTRIKGTAQNSSNLPVRLSTLLNQSFSNKKDFTGEPVPRLAKGSGDLLLQGSNNAGIHITTEKFGTGLNAAANTAFSLGTSENINAKPLSPAIDLFVGRKKKSISDIAFSGKFSFVDKSRTQTGKMNFVANSSLIQSNEFIENDKMANVRLSDESVFDHEINDNITDGVDVAARLYLSHNSSPDFTFGSSFDVLSGHTGECVVTYADINRVVGNESARIVSKKGESFIDLDPNGNAVIKASKDNGQQFLSLGVNGTTRLQALKRMELAVRGGGDSPEEPYVLYSELKIILDKIFSNLLVLNDIYLTNIGNTFSTANTIAVTAKAAGTSQGLVGEQLDQFVNNAVKVGMVSLVVPAEVTATNTTGETKITSSDATRTGTSKSAAGPLGSTKIFGE